MRKIQGNPQTIYSRTNCTTVLWEITFIGRTLKGVVSIVAQKVCNRLCIIISDCSCTPEYYQELKGKTGKKIKKIKINRKVKL